MFGTQRLWEGAWREARPVPVREPDAPPRLTTRERIVFKAIVHSYVLTAEPVGSRAVARRYRFGISPATIRNVMMDLEDMGLVEQPHASAGRVPTDLGYRLYVDEIMRPEGLERQELQAIDRELDRAPTEAESMLELATALMGRLSTQLAVAFTSDPWMDHIHFGGAGRVMSQPEFRVSDKLRGLFEALETREPLVRLLSAERAAEPGRVQVSIGAEIPEEAMQSLSIISASYGTGEVMGHVGLIGPTRMRYPRLVSLVCYTAAAVSERLGRMWGGPGSTGGQD